MDDLPNTLEEAHREIQYLRLRAYPERYRCENCGNVKEDVKMRGDAVLDIDRPLCERCYLAQIFCRDDCP